MLRRIWGGFPQRFEELVLSRIIGGLLQEEGRGTIGDQRDGRSAIHRG